jgi:hypothetical protein
VTALVLFLAFIGKHAAALAVLLFVAAMTGTLFAGREESIGLRLALGLAAIGQIFVLLGIAGLLRPWVIVTVAIALTIGGVTRSSFPQRSIRWPWLAAIAAAIMPFLLLALFPPIAFDETLYHLPFVQHLARSGTIEFLGNLRFPAFPLLHELLTVPLFLSLGDTATHLVTLAELIALAAVMIASCNGERRTAGILAAALCLGHPIVVQFGTVNYVEIALTLFVTAGFVCLDRITTIPQSSILNPQSRYAALAGFFLGTACSVKHLGWYLAAAGFAYLLFFGAARKRTVPIFLCALALATLPMYGEIVSLSGNPVHPFAPSIFGVSPWTLPDAYGVTPATRVSGGLRLLWNITFAREWINMQPPYSPLFAIAFLITLAASFRHRSAAFIAAIVVGYIAIFTFLPQDSRYLMPLIPLVSIVAARVMASWLDTRRRGATIATALSLLFIAPAFAYAGYRLAKQGMPPATEAQRHRYLEQRIPTYRALHQRGPGPIYVCGAEELQAFANEVIGDFNGRAPIQIVIGESRDAEALARSLQHAGATELLISRVRCPAPWQSLPREPYFRLIYEDEGAMLWRLTSSPPQPTRDSAR